jgi:heat shock protein HslJ
MNKKRTLFLSKLFLILVLTGNITLTAQDGTGEKSGGCGGGKSKTKANISNTNVSNANVSDPSANNLDARRWNLIEIGGGAVERSKAFIEFDSTEKRFSGNAGCNRMFGKFDTSGNEIKFSGIGATKMFCSEEGVMKLETDFIKSLETVTRYKQTGDTLIFYAGENPVLKFSGAAKNTNSNDNSGNENSNVVKLEDKKWVLTSIAGKPTPKIEKDAFLVFDKQRGSAGGNSGCNSFGGSYKTDADKISFTEIIQTFIACEDERGGVERQFLGGLQKANRFEIKAGTLNLFEGDRPLLTFEAREKN